MPAKVDAGADCTFTWQLPVPMTGSLPPWVNKAVAVAQARMQARPWLPLPQA
jgi:hypothetical protein